MELLFFNQFKLLKEGSFFILLFIISFISWNYIGVLFFIYGYFLIRHVTKSNKLNFKNYLLKTVNILAAWEFGALLWMLEIDKGFFGLIAHFLISLLVFIFYYILLTKDNVLNVFIFFALWIFYEFLQNFIAFSFPWLILGNVFSNQIYIIQWYKYTSVIGGSFWFLMISFILYKYLNEKKYLFFLLPMFLLPIFFSFTFLEEKNINSSNNIRKIVLYNPEFEKKEIKNSELAFYLYNELKKVKNVKTLIAPEHTFNKINIDKFEMSLTSNFLRKLFKETDIEEMYLGSSYYKSSVNKTLNVNGALYLTKEKTYNKAKKKLVPFTEYLPSVFSKFLKKKSFDSNVRDSESYIIDNLNITPLICYEVFFPFFVSKRVNKNKFIYLISSEKFFKSSSLGRNQYNNIIKLRCIENKINMIKNSSYGDSYLINHQGIIEQKSRKKFSVFNIKI